MGRCKKVDKACKQLTLTARAMQILMDWKKRYKGTYSDAIEKVDLLIKK